MSLRVTPWPVVASYYGRQAAAEVHRGARTRGCHSPGQHPPCRRLRRPVVGQPFARLHPGADAGRDTDGARVTNIAADAGDSPVADRPAVGYPGPVAETQSTASSISNSQPSSEHRLWGGSAVSSAPPAVYVVRKGDTLSGIAKRFAVTLRNILAANPQIKDPSLIHVGDAIKIPAAYLPTLGGSGTSPADINNRGQIVTGEDYILQDGVKTRLGTLGGRETAAMAINDLGQVVGYGTTESGDEHAFIWQDGVMTDLGPAAPHEGGCG